MEFDLNKTIEIIERTPAVLNSLLKGISHEWVHNNEGENTWTAFDVVGHLIICEITDFIPRTAMILDDTKDKTFIPIDMFAHFERDKGKTIDDLLIEFEQLRKESIQQLRSFKLTEKDLQATAVHPKIGRLLLSELLATWAVHDLNHISQVTRVMAKQYKQAVGPFRIFTGIIK